MTATFVWTDDLITGNDQVDEQHKELISRLNLLIESVWSGTGQKEAIRVIDFLGSYVIEHFGTEEELMMSSRYPEFAPHKAVHDQFIQRFAEIRSQFEEEGMKSELALSILDDVCDWLRSHILNLDMKVAAYVRQKDAGVKNVVQHPATAIPSVPPSPIVKEEPSLQEVSDLPNNSLHLLFFGAAAAIVLVIAAYFLL